jgi:hypothetical protein
LLNYSRIGIKERVVWRGKQAGFTINIWQSLDISRAEVWLAGRLGSGEAGRLGSWKNRNPNIEILNPKFTRLGRARIRMIKIDDFVRNRKAPFSVIPVPVLRGGSATEGGKTEIL